MHVAFGRVRLKSRISQISRIFGFSEYPARLVVCRISLATLEQELTLLVGFHQSILFEQPTVFPNVPGLSQ